jgi:transketolase
VKAWNDVLAQYEQKYPDVAKEFKRRVEGKLPDNWKSVLPTYKPEDPAKATRQFGQTVINKLAVALPELMGGSADLNPSTLTYLDCSTDYQKKSPQGRNIRFGVREHGMAAICNGLAAYGGFIPYGATFFNFIQYCLPSVRLSALSHFGVLYIMTHDSIGLGEDGPTHQPIESLMTVRAMPNIMLFRPADGNEVSGAYLQAIESRHRPSVICLSRQAVPNLKGTSIEGVSKGAYVIQDSETKPDVILTGTGTEVHLCTGAIAKLPNLKVRVVSFPSFEVFAHQPKDYQLSVFPDGVPVLAVEAGTVFGWHEYSHSVLGMKSFGASAPAKDVFNRFGFTPDNVAKRAQELVDFYKGVPAPSIINRPSSAALSWD